MMFVRLHERYAMPKKVNDGLPRDWIAGLGMSAREIAEYCGVPVRQVVKWRAGDCSPTASRKRKLLMLVAERKIVGKDGEVRPRTFRQKQNHPGPRLSFSPARVKRLLRDLGWSANQASQRTPFGNCSWSHWQSGHRTPSTSAVVILEAMEAYVKAHGKPHGSLVVSVTPAQAPAAPGSE